MKKIFAFLAVFLLVGMIGVLAEETTEVTATDSETNGLVEELDSVKAGMTPDSPFYGLERAMERIRENLVFKSEKKAELKLKRAQERLKEAEEMADKGLEDEALEAQEAHEEIMSEVEEDISEIEDEGEEELETVLGLQTAIEAHYRHVERFREHFQNKNFTESQMQKFEQIANRFQEKTQALEQKAVEKQERSEAKIRAKLNGKADEVIEKIKGRGRGKGDDEEVETEDEEENETDDDMDMGITPIDVDKGKTKKAADIDDMEEETFAVGGIVQTTE